MNNILKKSMALLIIMLVVISAMPSAAFGASSPPATAVDTDLTVTGYVSSLNSIAKGAKVNITLNFKYTGSAPFSVGNLDITRLVDSFNNGRIGAPVVDDNDRTKFSVTVSNLEYKGTGNSLKLMLGLQGNYNNETIAISECREYQEPPKSEPTPPNAVPSPQVSITRNEISSPIKANESMVLTLKVKNLGPVTMQSPNVVFNLSDALMLTGTSSSVQLKSIAPGSEETIQVPIKAFEKITNQNQYLEAEVNFRYNNTISVVDGKSSGRVTIPAKVTQEKKSEEEIASPIPNVIIKNFNYGGASIPAGSEFVLGVTLLNTSKTIKVENVVATVQGGTGFSINGSGNTFYFDNIKKRGTVSFSIPLKAAATFENNSQSVSIAVKYEYVDNKKRAPLSAELQVSIPVYQKDQFEIEPPKIPGVGMVGEESSFTMTYTNKGKSLIYNLEASLTGDVTSPNPKQNIGNIEAGKNGSIAFAYTPEKEGENNIKITIRYEDANGQAKKRVFTQTINAEAMMLEEPMPEMPEDIPSDKPAIWPWILGGAIFLFIATIILLKRRKRKKAAAQEAAMWSEWDDKNDAPATAPADQGSGNGEAK